MGILGKLKSIVDFGFKVLPDAPPLTERQERGLALGAVYAAGDYLPINALTTAGDPHTAAKILDQSWDVNDAQSARNTYRYLLDGGHRDLYTCVRGYLNAGWDLSRADERARIEQATREIPALAMQRGQRPDVALNYFQSGWQYRASMQWYYPRRIIESIAAWDAARVVHVSRFIVDAGFLDPAEAWAAIDAAVQMARPQYPSWAEFQLGFLAGRVFWAANAGFDGQEIDADYRRYTSAGKSLLSKPDSPWLRLAW
ncbi:DUF1266 domain-containing protein [Catenulispora pinisilvae]|uniref:DUF1266 domain-containing protein n=1 Tax=Catenulispora pinisilvae TaxID=2705253 RepID=UPI0018921CD3|nr:DUF1266 domain-containing protein [Catenulispora pinisilvae]